MVIEGEQDTSEVPEVSNGLIPKTKVIIKSFEIMGCHALSVTTNYGGRSAVFLLHDFQAICADGFVSGIILRSGERLIISVDSECLTKAFEDYMLEVKGE